MKHKRFFNWLALLSLLLCSLFSTITYAGTDLNSIVIANESQITAPVYDEAGLLSETEKKQLTERAAAISEQYQCQVGILVLNDTGKYKVRDYMEAIFLRCGFGYGSEQSGILLGLSTAKRDWQLLTYGSGIQAITDYGTDYISESILKYLKKDQYYNAFDTFVTLADRFLEEAAAGTPFDTDHPARLTTMAKLKPYLFSFGIAFVIALVICLGLVGSMKVASSRKGAANYMTPGSFQLTKKRDYYLYTTVVRTKRETKSSSGSSSGSSTNSNGFGGGGGKY